MELPLNHNQPAIMHMDLNSCFATVEQQANMHLRGKPLVIAAYISPGGCIISPSIEAKRLGIKVGMTVRDAKLIYKNVIVRDPDPLLVRDVHIKFKRIFQTYSPIVIPKSIDEAVIDFTGTPAFKKGLVNIAKEIKQRLREEIGEWISCSIGIATNRFLAKLGASIHKPDGLDVIDYKNLQQIYSSVKLVDLHGINTRYEARLNASGIFTPLQFLNASERFLHKQVFKGIVGYYWYLRLRGFEIDDVEFKRKSYGQEYSLGKKTADPEELSHIIMKLCEKMGGRLRRSNHASLGIHVAVLYDDWTFWHRGRKINQPLYTTQELFIKAMWIFNQQPQRKTVAKLAVSCYDLIPASSSQMSLFDIEENKKRKISDAIDSINDRYGEFVITPALMMNMKDLVVDRVAFGSVKELEDLYASSTSTIY
ncbi:MAG: Nucleotidyltransferase/DNA polymerase involved in DNA repair [Candidatus Roizmanbacteria bacterium GW2011_GWA2_36_23]|uniref:Nucleotidyltransferase/DNA polymerase involved in DNA repair n=1 Tax=Candidatus Roizmanbacteria bacterium GW2011_GWA2_36_23 TaxID=1618480 RepID=A0A0G0GP91_9BACT|nr:MAG: Nucleotidyltransferase/DNA polymerase involved in DNA repair [Candidatus Roizmanbacteria bacterium GW2011_GWA2_36_23]